MTSLSLRKNFTWTLAGQVIYAACQWGIITLLARQGTAAMVGEYALALAIAAPVVMFLNFKLRAVQASDARDEYAFSDYFGLRIITSMCSIAVISAVAFMGDRSGTTQATILILGVAKGLESISDILFGLQQKNERMDLVARSTMVKGILSLVFFYLGFNAIDEVYGGAIGVAVAWLITLLGIDLPLARRTFRLATVERSSSVDVPAPTFRPAFVLPTMRSLLWITIPLGVTVSLGSLSSNIPRYFIEHLLGAGALGIYAAMIYPLTAGSMIISALAQSATPRLSSYFQSEALESFYKLLAKLVVMGGAIGLAGVLAVAIGGRYILGILYGEEYAGYHMQFVWVMINAAIGYAYVFLGTALNAMRRFRVQLPIHVVSVTLLIVLCWVFIGRLGMNGALLALTITALSELIMYAIIVVRGIRSVLSTGDTPGKVGGATT